MHQSVAAFSLQGVSQSRNGVRALEDINLELPAGNVSTLIGPSGAGKSALLRLLNRLDDPVAGEIRYRGQSIVGMPVRTLRQRVGFVFQAPVPFTGTVRDNLVVAATIAGTQSADVASHIEKTLTLAGVDRSLLDRPADRLSGGQLQRVALARALMTHPETLVLDEPTAALDPEIAEELGKTIVQLSKDTGLTVVMATHRVHEARDISSYVVMLDRGHVVEAGAADQLFTSDHPRIRTFLSTVGQR